jgi:hypothetical protein
MKKAFLLVVVMVSMTMGAFAQGNSDSDQQLINKARVAAQQAGCLSDYNGAVGGLVTVVSICFVDGFVTEVLLFPSCHGPICAYSLFGPLAKVTFFCDDEVASIECY